LVIERLIKLKIMKKTLFAIAVATVFTACHSNTSTKTNEDTTRTLSYTDSMNNQSLLNDKANEVNLNGLSDTLITRDGSQYVKVDPNKAETPEVAPVAPVKSSTTRTRTRTRSGSSGSSGSSTANSGGSSSTGTSPVYSGTETASTPVPAKKKGWSKAAKGAAIGAGTGAVAGAIISKKKGVGAVVGGLIGAGGGYIIGRKADKKDGRVQ
jgi:hypothetical protein